MLISHLQAIEAVLTAFGQVAANSYVSKGAAREIFLREFLANHLAETVSIGTGEIIDCNTAPGTVKDREGVNQHDVVIYKKNLPKIAFATGTSAFFIESVVATIEVKSTLTKDELKKSFKAAWNVKNLTPYYEKRYLPFTFSILHPYPICMVVAYTASTDNMDTVYKWIRDIQEELGIPDVPMPDNDDGRAAIHAPALDGVYILGVGSAEYGNTRTLTDEVLASIRARMGQPGAKVPWILNKITTTGICLSNLFLKLVHAISAHHNYLLDPIPYYREGLKRQAESNPEKQET